MQQIKVECERLFNTFVQSLFVFNCLPVYQGYYPFHSRCQFIIMSDYDHGNTFLYIYLYQQVMKEREVQSREGRSY